jgi:hypothetical protein
VRRSFSRWSAVAWATMPLPLIYSQSIATMKRREVADKRTFGMAEKGRKCRLGDPAEFLESGAVPRSGTGATRTLVPPAFAGE